MQTRDQGKRPKDWKVVAAIATASALGISGLALAGPSGGRDTPDPINLRDQTNITEVTTPSTSPTTAPIFGAEASDSRNSLDSPFDDPTTTTTIVVVDPTNPVVSSSGDSPDVTNPPTPAPAPDPAPPPAGSADSGSAGSADNSADS